MRYGHTSTYIKYSSIFQSDYSETQNDCVTQVQSILNLCVYLWIPCLLKLWSMGNLVSCHLGTSSAIDLSGYIQPPSVSVGHCKRRNCLVERAPCDGSWRDDIKLAMLPCSTRDALAWAGRIIWDTVWIKLQWKDCLLDVPPLAVLKITSHPLPTSTSIIVAATNPYTIRKAEPV